VDDTRDVDYFHTKVQVVSVQCPRVLKDEIWNVDLLGIGAEDYGCVGALVDRDLLRLVQFDTR